MQKVLVVDDNSDLRAIIRRLLEKHGFSVTEAASGRRALDQLEIELPAAATARPGEFYLRAVGRRVVGGAGHDLVNADYLFHTATNRIRVVEPLGPRDLLAAFSPWH